MASIWRLRLRGDGFSRLNLWRASSTASVQTTRHAFSDRAASRAVSRSALVGVLPATRAAFSGRPCSCAAFLNRLSSYYLSRAETTSGAVRLTRRPAVDRVYWISVCFFMSLRIAETARSANICK